MTIAVAVRTESAVVLAADSKLTTQGPAGREENGQPRLVEQTYDNATKVVHARSGFLIAMVAGAANIGRLSATDFIQMLDVTAPASVEEQDRQISDIVARMVELKKEFWSRMGFAPSLWPGPTILFAAPGVGENAFRVWRVDLQGEGSEMTEPLPGPFVRFEGAYNEVFALLYGYEENVLNTLAKELGANPDQLVSASQKLKFLRPIDQINFYTMPLQDAIDFAVFLATVQIEMDRFTPGTPLCGGPIDVMVLRVTPVPEILSYPGKVLHHPHSRVKM